MAGQLTLNHKTERLGQLYAVFTKFQCTLGYINHRGLQLYTIGVEFRNNLVNEMRVYFIDLVDKGKVVESNWFSGISEAVVIQPI